MILSQSSMQEGRECIFGRVQYKSMGGGGGSLECIVKIVFTDTYIY